MSLPQYLKPLDWTGRQLQAGKRGSISQNVPPILDRLDLSPKMWLYMVKQFGKRRAANRITPVSRFNATAQKPAASVSPRPA